MLFDKKSFKVIFFFVGNLSAMRDCSPMSDSFDITSTACAGQSSAREFIKCGRETYKLHSVHESGVPIYKRIYNGECNRGGGSQWLAKSVSYKSLASARANLDFFELHIA
jgi:hypothetical protein